MLVFGLTALQPAHIRLNPQLFFRRLCVWSVLFHCVFLFRVPEPFHFQSTFGHLAGGMGCLRSSVESGRELSSRAAGVCPYREVDLKGCFGARWCLEVGTVGHYLDREAIRGDT